MPGQTALLMNTLLNFLVLGLFLFLSTWCFLHQTTLVSWLSVQAQNEQANSYKVVLQASGSLAIFLSIIAFQALLKSQKIAWTHNTLHTILLVWSIVLVVFSGAILLFTK